MKLQYVDVLGPKDFETAFRGASKGQADAILWLVVGAIASSHRKGIINLAVKSRFPVIYPQSIYVAAGRLMIYSARITDSDRRAAAYVDKILKAAKSADLTVVRPTKFEFVINLKAAKQIGLTIPPNVLVRTAKMIK